MSLTRLAAAPMLLFPLLTLTGCAADPGAHVVAFGDSVTFGYGGQPGGWVTILSDRTGVPIANYGFPGELVLHGKDRFIGPVGPLALSPGDTRVLLMHGGNDVADLFLGSQCNRTCTPESMDAQIDRVVGDISTIVDEAQAYHRSVTLSTYWQVNARVCANDDSLNLTPAQTLAGNAFIAAYDRKLVSLAAVRNLPVVRLDLIGLDEDSANFYNCIHPSDIGYHKVAEAYYDALARGKAGEPANAPGYGKKAAMLGTTP